MKDVEKTNVERENSSKRLRRRKRKMNLYSFIVILLVMTVAVTVSYTFLFNISEIRVAGESDEYTAEEIVTASGVMKGDNLLRLNTKKSEQRILDTLLYVETAVVDRDFPSSLNITVSKCVPAFNVSYEMGTLLVSKKGKILADNGFITPGLPIFYGYDPAETTPGKALVSKDEQKSQAFEEFIGIMNDAEEAFISSIDMSDKYEIIVNYANGIIFKMGNWTDINYKLDMADNVMNTEGIEGKKGYITMIGSNQCSFRTSDSPVYIPGTTMENTTMDPALTQPATDTNGIPLATAPQIGTVPADPVETTEPPSAGTAQSEVNDEEEEMFREHDEMIQQQQQATAESAE